MYKIIGKYKGKREELDEAEDRKEAHRLAQEYRLAFGPEWVIEVRIQY